jgi:hypothetical protein
MEVFSDDKEMPMQAIYIVAQALSNSNCRTFTNLACIVYKLWHAAENYKNWSTINC